MDPFVIILGVCGVLLVVVLFKTAKVVPNQQAFIVERLGKFHTVLYAGFHILIPFLDVIAYKRSLKELVYDVPKQTCITRDNVTVDIDGVLYLQIVNPEKSAYGISDFLIGSVQLAQTALRSAIGKLELDRTFEERNTINQEVIAALDAATAPWGLKVLRYEIRDITPPSSVMQAMEKQMRAEREKRAVIASSEGEMQSQINIAEGLKAAAIAESEGKMQALKNQAQGEAALIEAVARATSEGLHLVAAEMNTENGIAAANLRVAESWISQYGNIAKAGTTMIIPQDLANIGGIVAGLSHVISSPSVKNLGKNDICQNNTIMTQNTVKQENPQNNNITHNSNKNVQDTVSKNFTFNNVSDMKPAPSNSSSNSGSIPGFGSDTTR